MLQPSNRTDSERFQSDSILYTIRRRVDRWTKTHTHTHIHIWVQRIRIGPLVPLYPFRNNLLIVQRNHNIVLPKQPRGRLPYVSPSAYQEGSVAPIITQGLIPGTHFHRLIRPKKGTLILRWIRVSNGVDQWFSSFFFWFTTHYPVSYTHLDVYKRQHYDRATCSITVIV